MAPNRRQLLSAHGAAVSLALAFAGAGFVTGCNVRSDPPAAGVDTTRTPAPPPTVAAAAAQSCDSAATQLEISSCFANAADSAETQEAARYDSAAQSLQSKGSAARAAALARAEERWKAYRDAHCEAAAEQFSGGSLGRTAGLVCRARLAGERSTELQKIYIDAPR